MEGRDDNPPLGKSEKRLRTLDLKANPNELLKPGELIDVRGTQKLKLSDRQVYNKLVANAFGPQMGEQGACFQIAIKELRQNHKGNERLKPTLIRLMGSVVETTNARGGDLLFNLLGTCDLDNENRVDGILKYSFDPRLVAIMRDSVTFGKLQLKVMGAFQSKYSLALYEFGVLRVRLDYKSWEEMTLEEFREIMGVEAGKLVAYSSLRQRVIETALEEVNAFAEFQMWVRPRKTGRMVTHVAIGWEWKSHERQDEAFRELNRPRVGRKARIRGEVTAIREYEAFQEAA